MMSQMSLQLHTYFFEDRVLSKGYSSDYKDLPCYRYHLPTLNTPCEFHNKRHVIKENAAFLIAHNVIVL